MFEMNRAHGATLVLVTHDVELARRCDATVTIEAGRLV
jgi:putative ABC transport system ATP-binding protein